MRAYGSPPPPSPEGEGAEDEDRYPRSKRPSACSASANRCAMRCPTSSRAATCMTRRWRKHLVSVTEVRMSPDLRHATVFVKPLLGKDEEAVLKALRTNTAYLQREVARAGADEICRQAQVPGRRELRRGQAYRHAAARPEGRAGSGDRRLTRAVRRILPHERVRRRCPTRARSSSRRMIARCARLAGQVPIVAATGDDVSLRPRRADTRPSPTAIADRVTASVRRPPVARAT